MKDHTIRLIVTLMVPAILTGCVTAGTITCGLDEETGIYRCSGDVEGRSGQEPEQNEAN